jgi:hypothetical protein
VRARHQEFFHFTQHTVAVQVYKYIRIL